MHKNSLVALENTDIKCHVLGNISKDSLYAESSEESFIELREQFDVGTSEMEFSTINRLALEATLSGDSVIAGCILTVLGVIPGASFADDKLKEDVASKCTMLAALETLHQLSLEHK